MRKLVYIIEGANWSTDWDGKSIVANLNKIRGEVFAGHWAKHTNKIIHLGCLPLFFAADTHQKLVIESIDPSNKIVLTIFHLNSTDHQRIKILLQYMGKISFIHTSCQITRKQLISLGIPDEKIRVIPLGVDLDIFTPVSTQQKKELRQAMDIPKNKIIIGSFQKDGQGWEKGNEPKLIKGPDIFCQVVENLSKKHKIHVLLTGPARGYVAKRLKKAGIAYLYRFIDNYEEIVDYFRALDFYLIGSRVEGGPKAILEGWATGIPIVSTVVGMVPDIAKNEEDALLAASENTDQLTIQTEKLILSPILREKLRQNGLAEVKKYAWKNIAERYYQELYKPLI